MINKILRDGKKRNEEGETAKKCHEPQGGGIRGGGRAWPNGRWPIHSSYAGSQGEVLSTADGEVRKKGGTNSSAREKEENGWPSKVEQEGVARRFENAVEGTIRTPSHHLFRIRKADLGHETNRNARQISRNHRYWGDSPVRQMTNSLRESSFNQSAKKSGTA